MSEQSNVIDLKKRRGRKKKLNVNNKVNDPDFMIENKELLEKLKKITVEYTEQATALSEKYGKKLGIQVAFAFETE